MLQNSNLAERKLSQQISTAGPQPRISVSRQMYERFERRKLWRRMLAGVYVVSFSVYLAWCFTIIEPSSLFLSCSFFAAECLGFILGLIGIITTWDYNHRDPLPCPANLSVDVFVTTFKEPLHVIRRTAMAAKAIDYPHKTWILDDGKRDEIKEMAKELGLLYLRRPDNANAKAGNLNYGFAHSKADFVLSLDADHIVLPHALDIMLGFFADKEVALVQTPQDFYNTDAFQYFAARGGEGLWHDQSSYYNIIEPCGDSINAATCIGTGVVYRRSAITDIGGIPIDSVTEDIHTSLKLQKQGYRVVFINEPVAYGIAEENLGEFYKVRHRWAHGNIHAVEVENVRFCKGLTLRQRLQYLALELVYLEGWQQLLIFLVPAIALLSGQQPFRITVFNMLVVMTFPIFIALLTLESGCGFNRFWAGQVLSMIRWPIHIISCVAVFRRKMPFRTSAKNTGKRIRWTLMLPQLGVMALNLVAFIYGVFYLSRHFKVGVLSMLVSKIVTTGHIPDIDVDAVLPRGYNTDLLLVAGFWSLYTVARGAAFIRKVISDARNNHDLVRFRVPLPVIFDGKGGDYGRVSAISENWIRFADYREGLHAVAGGTMNITLVMPGGRLSVKVAVENVEGRDIEGRLLFSSQAQADQLGNGLYSVDWHREFLHRNAYFPTPSDVLLRWLGLQSRQHWRYPWHAMLYHEVKEGAGTASYAIVSMFDNKTEASFIAFNEIEENVQVTGLVFADDGMRTLRAIVIGREPLSSLTPHGLDGAVVSRYRLRIVA